MIDLLKKDLFFVLLVGLLAVTSVQAADFASPPIPLDSRIYPVLDKLAGLGLIDAALQGSRPYTRLEAARQVREARQNAMINTPLPAAFELLRRLEMELHEPLADLDVLEGGRSAGYFKPIRSFDLAYVYQQGEPSPIPGTNARQLALNVNNFGIDYSEHHNGRLTFEGEARFGGRFLLYWRPLLEIQEDEGDESDTSLHLLHGMAALQLGPLELSAGRQSLWWGQGRHGSLVLTSNAKPLDMVRITNPSPGLLPWIFRYLGPFRFDFFLSRLEEERVVPEPYFGGLRLDFKPLPWLELGASRGVIFGGEGRPHLSFDDILTIIGGENLSGQEDTSNSVAAIDARLRLPLFAGMEIYGEWGGEDEVDLAGFIPFFSNESWLAGVYLPRIEPSGRLGLRFEYADLTRIDDNSPAWYRHGIYRSGYTYEKKILGHHVGGAGEDYFIELEAFLPKDLTLALSYERQRKGIDQDVAEKHEQGAIHLEWSAAPGFSLDLKYSLDRVENFAFQSDKERIFHLASAGVVGRW